MKQYRYAKIDLTIESAVVVDLFDTSLQHELDASASYPHGTIVQYSKEDAAGAGLVIQSVVAEPGTATSAIWHALSENSVIPYFPEAVLAEVQSIVDNPGIEDDSIADLTYLPFITIDNVDSRDLDQAMHISADDSGFTLHYALADAAFFVKPGSALFNEALRRGASYYVPGFSVPMLPAALSEGLISLNPAVLRRALVFIIRFDVSGVVLKTEVLQARMQSAAKLSYTGVEDYYKNPQHSPLHDQVYTPTLDVLRELGKLRIIEAKRRNVVEYNRSSVEVSLSNDGTEFEIADTDRLQVESYNEQISLICNAEGARLLKSAGLPSVVQGVFRVHDAPEEERLKKFSRLLKGLVKHYGLPPEIWVWRWRDGKYGEREYLADYLDRLKSSGVDDRLLSVVHRHSLMLSTASRFTAESGEHHSLKLQQYARFSSPMREVAGIYTHREYLQFLNHQEKSVDSDDSVLREQVIDAANHSKEIQKKLNKAVMKNAIDQLFSDQLELRAKDRYMWSGTVISLRSTRIYVKIDSPAITVKVYLRKLSELNGVKYQLDKSSAFVTGDDSSVIALGQKLNLQVHGYQEDSARWSLLPLAVE